MQAKSAFKTWKHDVQTLRVISLTRQTLDKLSTKYTCKDEDG